MCACVCVRTRLCMCMRVFARVCMRMYASMFLCVCVCTCVCICVCTSVSAHRCARALGGAQIFSTKKLWTTQPSAPAHVITCAGFLPSPSSHLSKQAAGHLHMHGSSILITQPKRCFKRRQLGGLVAPAKEDSSSAGNSTRRLGYATNPRAWAYFVPRGEHQHATTLCDELSCQHRCARWTMHLHHTCYQL